MIYELATVRFNYKHVTEVNVHAPLALLADGQRFKASFVTQYCLKSTSIQTDKIKALYLKTALRENSAERKNRKINKYIVVENLFDLFNVSIFLQVNSLS